MKHLCIVLSIVAVSCADTWEAPGSGHGAPPSDDERAQVQQSLELRPRVELVGVSEAFEAVEVTHIAFAAELFLVPESDSDDVIGGDAVGIEFDFDQGHASTRLRRRSLKLQSPGRYELFFRVRPDNDGTSVAVSAKVGPQRSDQEESGGTVRPKAGASEPVPSPAEPVPSPAEPVPSPAEPVPSPAEPVPSPADESEPVPSPADGAGQGEQAAPDNDDDWMAESDPTATSDRGDGDHPLPGAEPVPSPAEPVPSPAEPVPSPARQKGELGDRDLSKLRADLLPDDPEHVYVRFRQTFDFYAGVIEVEPNAEELVVTWDVRHWLRELLGDTVGSDHSPTPSPLDRFETEEGSFHLAVH